MEDITRLTVHELVEKLNKNELSSEKIVKAYKARIEDKEKDVKAFITTTLDEAEKEDIITNMISIKTRAKIVKDQFNFKDISSLVGTKFTDDTKYEKTNLNPAIPEEQKNNCYIWTQEDLNNQGLASINSDESKFYVVYYGDNNEQKLI